MNFDHQAESLYLHYAETGPIDDLRIWEKYQALRAGILHLPQYEQVMILELAADLANTQEHAAFLAGLRAGRAGQ